MRIGKLLGWGIVMYAIVALAWSLLIAWGFGPTLFARLVELVALIFVLIVATRSLRLHSPADILPYSIGWTVIVTLFDFMLFVPYEGLTIYNNWNLWVGYAIVLLVPLLIPHGQRAPEPPPSA